MLSSLRWLPLIIKAKGDMRPGHKYVSRKGPPGEYEYTYAEEGVPKSRKSTYLFPFFGYPVYFYEGEYNDWKGAVGDPSDYENDDKKRARRHYSGQFVSLWLHTPDNKRKLITRMNLKDWAYSTSDLKWKNEALHDSLLNEISEGIGPLAVRTFNFDKIQESFPVIIAIFDKLERGYFKNPVIRINRTLSDSSSLQIIFDKENKPLEDAWIHIKRRGKNVDTIYGGFGENPVSVQPKVWLMMDEEQKRAYVANPNIFSESKNNSPEIQQTAYDMIEEIMKQIKIKPQFTQHPEPPISSDIPDFTDDRIAASWLTSSPLDTNTRVTVDDESKLHAAEKWVKKTYDVETVNFSGMDLHVLMTTLSAWKTMANMYPQAAARVREIHTESEYDFASKTANSPSALASVSSFGSIINLNLKYYSNFDRFRESIKQNVTPKSVTLFHPLNGDTIRSVLIHEFGHVLHYWLISPDIYRVGIVPAVSKYVDAGTYGQGYFGDVGGTLAKFLIDREPGAARISQYATTNNMEAFAEAFEEIHGIPPVKLKPYSSGLKKYLAKAIPAIQEAHKRKIETNNEALRSGKMAPGSWTYYPPALDRLPFLKRLRAWRKIQSLSEDLDLLIDPPKDMLEYKIPPKVKEVRVDLNTLPKWHIATEYDHGFIQTYLTDSEFEHSYLLLDGISIDESITKEKIRGYLSTYIQAIMNKPIYAEMLRVGLTVSALTEKIYPMLNQIVKSRPSLSEYVATIENKEVI